MQDHIARFRPEDSGETIAVYENPVEGSFVSVKRFKDDPEPPEYVTVLMHEHQPKSLATMASEVHMNNVDKGWFEKDRTFGDDIALLHSEVSEMLEAFRDHGVEDATKHVRNEEVRCAGGMHCRSEAHKPEGVGSEAADVLIRLLDTCHRYGIDLRGEYERKLAFNRTRPVRHGGRRL